MGACSAGVTEAFPGGCSAPWALLDPPRFSLTAISLQVVVLVVSVDTLNVLDCCLAVLCQSFLLACAVTSRLSWCTAVHQPKQPERAPPTTRRWRRLYEGHRVRARPSW